MTQPHTSAGTGPGDADFAVFTDRADAAAVACSFARPGTRTLAHASGRPWLVGRWADEEIVTARAGHAALAVIGSGYISIRAPLPPRTISIAALASLVRTS